MDVKESSGRNIYSFIAETAASCKGVDFFKNRSNHQSLAKTPKQKSLDAKNLKECSASQEMNGGEIVDMRSASYVINGELDWWKCS